MRLPLPQWALVQVTWSSSVFWRHLCTAEQRGIGGVSRACTRGSALCAADQLAAPVLHPACGYMSATLGLTEAPFTYQWHVTPCLES